MIINADDFGLCASVNEAIAQSFQNGWINQTTLMVNMPSADAAVEMAVKYGFYDHVGLHLNFTEGVPLTRGMLQSSFCRDGKYDGMSQVGKGLYLGGNDRLALRMETEAQIKRYLKYSLPLLHADSHHHVCFRLPVAAVVLPLLKKYGFISVRRPYNTSRRGGGLVRRFLRWGRNGCFLTLASWCRLSTTSYFGSAVPNPVRIQNGTAEYMVHPRLDADGNVINVVAYEKGTGPLMKEVFDALQFA